MANRAASTSDAPVQYDILIVGGGTAGCVVASRLSERANLKVLLIEAGPDRPPGLEHPDIIDPYPLALGNPGFSWPGLRVALGERTGNGTASRGARPFLQGYGVGGSSNIQGMIAFRGQPADYDAWEAAGAKGWGWNGVLPYFRKLESDRDFAGDAHGREGPIPVRRIAASDWAPFAKAIGTAIERRGYPRIEDYNADFRDGSSALPMSNLPQQRVSASMGYLSASVRCRPNLRILANAMATRVLISAGRARSVEIRTPKGLEVISAAQIILCCGALYTPALLLRSGIGPPHPLQALGIGITHPLPAVGRHLQNHPKVELAVHLPRGSVQPRAQRGFGQSCLRFSSGRSGGRHDLGIVVINKAAWHPLGRRIGALGIALYQPQSHGHVALESIDPQTPPRVSFNALSDPRDLERLVVGLRFACELLCDPAVIAVRNEVFLPDGKAAARLNRRRLQTRIRASLIAAALDISAMRRTLLGRAIVSVADLARDEAGLHAFVKEHAGISHHPCGTCRMGPPEDGESVVDEGGRVHGVDSLRVIDASVFPTIVSGNTHLPVIMVAEKMSDQIKASL